MKGVGPWGHVLGVCVLSQPLSLYRQVPRSESLCSVLFFYQKVLSASPQAQKHGSQLVLDWLL